MRFASRTSIAKIERHEARRRRRGSTMTKRAQCLSTSVLLVLVAITTITIPTIASAEEATCGSKENPCPLQKWMRANVGAPMARGDLPVVASGLEKAAAFAPDPSWTEWASIAKEGAAAAKKGDVAATKATCKSCHDKFKAKYKENFRARPLP